MFTIVTSFLPSLAEQYEAELHKKRKREEEGEHLSFMTSSCNGDATSSTRGLRDDVSSKGPVDMDRCLSEILEKNFGEWKGVLQLCWLPC